MLSRSSGHDVYHLPEYHSLAERRGEGRALLFVHEDGPHHVAVPLLLRRVEMPGIEPDHSAWEDATSVYGYGGPIASADPPETVVNEYRRRLTEALRARRVVSVFSRLHPLLPQRGFLPGPETYLPFGRTVSMDLTLPDAEQYARYRKNHKNGINRLRRAGWTCVRDVEAAHLDGFVRVYTQTMRRVGAAGSYFFDRSYFAQLLADLGPRAHLFVCLSDDDIAAGGVFTLCDGNVQYHLGGTGDAFLKQAPMKLVFDTVRRWANEHAARVFHLGGGVGGQEDSLFHFKAGFSNRTHEVAAWRWILDPDAVAALRDQRARYERRHGRDLDRSSAYFPPYRAPAIPSAAG